MIKEWDGIISESNMLKVGRRKNDKKKLKKKNKCETRV